MPSTDTQASAAAMDQAAAIGAEGGVPAATAEALRQGINLQGWKLWDPSAFVTPAMAARFAADGFDHARIYYHAGMTQTGPVDNNAQRWPRDEAALDADAVTDRIEDSMQNLIAAGLKVVINPVPDFSPDDTAATRQAKLEFFAPGHDRLDLTAFKGGVRVNAGSGDDRIALHGKGGTAAAARVDGAVGTDTVVLEGLAADWRLLTRSDPEGPAQLAKSTAYGSYLLVNVEHVAFAGAAGQAAQGGGFDLVA